MSPFSLILFFPVFFFYSDNASEKVHNGHKGNNSITYHPQTPHDAIPQIVTATTTNTTTSTVTLGSPARRCEVSPIQNHVSECFFPI